LTGILKYSTSFEIADWALQTRVEPPRRLQCKGYFERSLLIKVIVYCDEIDEANEFFGKSLERLEQTSTYRNALAMCILQIGELVGNLTDEFKSAYPDMPWQDIKKMRNIAAHRYGSFDAEILFDTVENDIPPLRKYCTDIINEHKG